MKKILQKIGLLIISTSITLMFLEGLSRIILKSAYTHVVDKNGDMVSMQINPGNLEMGLKPFFKGRMISGEFNVSINLDSIGLRKRIEAGFAIEKAPLQIALLGDSFMFGWGVEAHQAFGSVLAKELNTILNQKIIVYPLAIPGTGQFSQLSLLKRTTYFKPDIIIVGMYVTNHIASGNDLIDNLNEYYKLYSKNASTKTNDNSKIDFLRQVRRWSKNNSNLFRFVETRLNAVFLARFSNALNIESDPDVMKNAWALTDSVLIDLQKEASLSNALLVIQYIPNTIDLLYSTKNKLNISDFYYVGDGHWNPKAHKIAAITTANFLSEISENTF